MLDESFVLCSSYYVSTALNAVYILAPQSYAFCVLEARLRASREIRSELWSLYGHGHCPIQYHHRHALLLLNAMSFRSYRAEPLQLQSGEALATMAMMNGTRANMYLWYSPRMTLQGHEIFTVETLQSRSEPVHPIAGPPLKVLYETSRRFTKKIHCWL